MSCPPHIVFAGGRFRGQLYPGLAVAGQLAERVPHAMITFVGGGGAGDRHVIRAAGFRHAKLPSQPAPDSALHAVRFVTDNVAGYLAARWYLKEKHVTAVVGLGGAASAPTVRAAISHGLPVVLIEQNVVPGRVTRWLARSARSVCAGFEQTRAYFPSAVRLAVTGNPVRAAFQHLHRKNRSEFRSTRKRLVILGGSGPSSLNENMPRALSRLRQELSGWQIVHQAGDGQLQETERRYHDVCVNTMVFAFVDEMAPLIFGADLVICRGGATTLAELALAGAPAVLVPAPRAMDYQWPNAEVYASAGAATIVDETDDHSASLDDALVQELKLLLVDDARRSRMASNMRRMARPDAAANVSNVIYDMLFGNVVRLAA